MKTIIIVKDFSRKPFGRSISRWGDTSGEYFRKNYLAPALNEHETVHVDMNGYNRYTRSFIDEAFGGLIRDEGFSYDHIKQKLTYEHILKSIMDLVAERIEKAQSDKERSEKE